MVATSTVGEVANDIANMVLADQTAEEIRAWVHDKLSGIRYAEDRGQREFVEQTKIVLPLQAGDGQLREVSIVVKIGDKPHKVQPSRSRSYGDNHNGNGHSDEEVPKGQTSFLMLDGPATPSMNYEVDEHGTVTLLDEGSEPEDTQDGEFTEVDDSAEGDGE